MNRDQLNPALNASTLKQRLAVIDHYKFRYGADYTYWVHTAMRNVNSHLWKYKFNYLLKAFFAYQALRYYQNYRYLEKMTLQTDAQRAWNLMPAGIWSATFVGTCFII